MLFWAGIIGCFIGEAFKVRVLDLFVLYPLRLILLLAIPVFLFYPTKFRKGIWSFAFFLIIMMLIYGTASLSWSPDPVLGLRIVNMLLTGFMIFLLLSRYAINQSILKNIMILWSVIIISINILGIYEMINGKYLFRAVNDWGGREWQLYRISEVGWLTPRVFFPNPNEFAFINALSALVLMGWMIESHGWKRFLAFFATLMAIVMVMTSYSRAAIFGLLIGILFFGSIFIAKMKISNRIVTIYVIIVIGILVLFKSAEFFENTSGASGLITKTTTSHNSENRSNYTTASSLGTYSSSVASGLITKTTTSSLNTERKFFYSTAFFQGTFNTMGFGKGLGASSEIILGGSYHNYLLEILAELGLWLFLGYLFLIIKVCIQLWHAIQQGRNIYWSCGLLASCIAFPICSAGPASLLYVYPYWFWLTFLVAYAENDSIESTLIVQSV